MIKKTIIKPLTNTILPSELPFYRSFLKERNSIKYSKAFKSYAQSYKVDVLDSDLYY